MTVEYAAIRHCTQLICEMLKKRRLRPLLLYRSISRAISLCENNDKNMKKYKDELTLAKKMFEKLEPKCCIPADVLIFRFFRAIPITKKSKKMMLAALQAYDVTNKYKWRLLPQSNHIPCYCSENAKQHIQVLTAIIQQCPSLNLSKSNKKQ